MGQRQNVLVALSILAIAAAFLLTFVFTWSKFLGSIPSTADIYGETTTTPGGEETTPFAEATAETVTEDVVEEVIGEEDPVTPPGPDL